MGQATSSNLTDIHFGVIIASICSVLAVVGYAVKQLKEWRQEYKNDLRNIARLFGSWMADVEDHLASQDDEAFDTKSRLHDLETTAGRKVPLPRRLDRQPKRARERALLLEEILGDA